MILTRSLDAESEALSLTDVKNQVGALVIEVAEKVLHKELSNKAAQETYINELAEGVKLN